MLLLGVIIRGKVPVCGCVCVWVCGVCMCVGVRGVCVGVYAEFRTFIILLNFK